MVGNLPEFRVAVRDPCVVLAEPRGLRCAVLCTIALLWPVVCCDRSVFATSDNISIRVSCIFLFRTQVLSWVNGS